MDYPSTSHSTGDLFPSLKEIPQPPDTLFFRGHLPQTGSKYLLVVGSRNYTNYGKQVVSHLISGLHGYPISIVSGLARGIDALAHEAALEAGLHTLAVPGSGLSDTVLYPRQNRMLAHRILESGGGLVSEFDDTFTATKWSFPKRNRIMAGIAHATLMIEASERSGTLITARLTAEYNRELLVVPGNIFSENSRGPHQFLKLGATPVTCAKDILDVFNIEEHSRHTPSVEFEPTSPEGKILTYLREPRDRDSLIRTLNIPANEANVLLMKLELSGAIREDNGVFYKT